MLLGEFGGGGAGLALGLQHFAESGEFLAGAARARGAGFFCGGGLGGRPGQHLLQGFNNFVELVDLAFRQQCISP